MNAGPPDLGGDFVPVARPRIAFVELEGEGVVMDEDSGAIHVLDPLATVVWKCCDGTGTVDELVADLSAAFDADADTIRQDVLRLLSDLAAEGLLEGVPAGDETPGSGE